MKSTAITPPSGLVPGFSPWLAATAALLGLALNPPLPLAAYDYRDKKSAAEPEVDASEMPRVPATEPEDVMDSFEVRPGFRLELVAHEPDVVDPIAMAFDESGAMFVVEMRGYSERREEALGRIRRLEDRDGDGVFEHSTVYQDGLKWPTCVLPYKGGVFVGATPDLFYFKDTDGDGVADEERKVFTGFGGGKPDLNMQALFNSLRWGPDNRIWGATAANGGKVTRPGAGNAEEISINRADFSFDPEKLDFRAENGTAQYGLSFDSQGRRFVCSNSRHAIWVAWERNQLLANPFYSPPAPLVDIPEDGVTAPVFRISPDEPWRVIRTRWRVAGVVKGIVEAGGRVSGFFTAAAGIHLYWGGAYGEDYRDNLFVGDVGSNLVHRKVLSQPGGQVQPLASRPEDEDGIEFLRSSDNWFRPCSFATGPDGCLYIGDMYRETIEHPWSLPPGIKKHLDLNSGYDRGRIYRMVPEGFERPAIPDLGEASDDELAELAQSAPDDWRRTTARRLLFERGQPVPPQLPGHPFPAGLASEQPLLDQLAEAQGDRWREAAVLNSLRREEDLLAAWEEVKQAHATESGGKEISSDFAAELTGMSGRSGSEKAIAAALAFIAGGRIDEATVSLLDSLKKGVTRSKKGAWGEVSENDALARLFERSAEFAADSARDETRRLAALRLLAFAPDAGRRTALLREIVADKTSADALVSEAARDLRDSAFLVERFDGLPSEARSHVAARLAKSARDARLLLDAVAEETLDPGLLPAEVSQSLREHADAKVKERAAEVLPEVLTREAVLAKYQPALGKEGDPAKGEAAFRKACLTCHQTIDGEGVVLGPPTATFKTAGKDSLLGNILDPNREVAPQYQAYRFTLKDGEVLVGLIKSEDSATVQLQMPGGIERSFPRTEVASMESAGQSLMPEGLEAVLSVEEMADLLAYLTE